MEGTLWKTPKGLGVWSDAEWCSIQLTISVCCWHNFWQFLPWPCIPYHSVNHTFGYVFQTLTTMSLPLVALRKYHEEIDSNFQPVSYSKYKQYLSRTVDTMDPGDWRSQSMIYEGLCVEAALGREMMVASHNKGLHLSRAPRLPTILTSEHNKALRASNKVPVMTWRSMEPWNCRGRHAGVTT